MNVLVIGSGGREHALVWKLRQSPKVHEVYCAPGNAGIESIAELVKVKIDDIDGLFQFAKKEKDRPHRRWPRNSSCERNR